MSQEGLLLLIFGHIRKYKGLDILLQALQTLHKKGRQVNLAIVGEPVGSFAEYQNLIDALPFPERVHTNLTYVATDLASRYLLASDVVVMPYRHIYQSGVVYLAHAHGRPVIATNVGGLPEVVTEGQTGFLIEKEDPAALATAIERFFEQRQLIETLGRHAYQLSQSKNAWNWQIIADRTIEVYRKILPVS